MTLMQSQIFCACIHRIPYIEVQAFDDDEAREKIFRTFRRKNLHGLSERWKQNGMEILPKTAKKEI